MKTSIVLKKMLTENTGIGFCDSGSVYGRHWQKNQGRDFAKEPKATIKFYPDGEIEIEYNLYHWLLARLEFASGMDRKFQRFARRNPDQNWLTDMEEFAKAKANDKINANTFNTHNGGGDFLGQTLQGVLFDIAGRTYVLLQIHGGCDVRGGYTKPRAFRCEDSSLCDSSGARIGCKNGHHWDTDDAGGNWYDSDGRHINFDFTDQPVEHDAQDTETLIPHEHVGGDKLYVNEDGNGYCPTCGEKIEVYA